MRSQKKNKTAIQRELFITNLAKNRHFSTTKALHETTAKAEAYEVIQMLLEEVYQIQYANECYYQTLSRFWNQIQSINMSYLQLMEPSNNQILSVLDQQPQSSQQKKKRGVLGPDFIKKTLLRSVKSRDQLIIAEESARKSIYEADKRDRQALIQKMKKQYIAIVNAKYISDSLPVKVSQCQLKQTDNQDLECLRNSLNNEAKIKKLKKVVHKKSENQYKLNQKQLTTFYKKSKEYIDKIDPTNYYYKTEVYEAETFVSPKRGSKYRSEISSLIGLEDLVTIQESNFKQITNTVKPSKEVVTQFGLKMDKILRSPTFIGAERDELLNRDDHSIQLKPNSKKLTNNSTKNQIRLKNSVSVCSLPKLKQ